MPTKIKVVLFEDTVQTRSEILQALTKHLGSDGSVIPFDGSKFTESPADKERTYEIRLESILMKAPYDSATIIVADRDLSKSQDSQFGGLSVNAVDAVSKNLAIPICSYAREPEPDDYDWRGKWREGHIVLRFSDGIDELARRAVIAARGFAEIAAQLSDSKATGSPAKILAKLLGKPEYSAKMALYSVGDHNRLPEVLAKDKDNWVQRMTHFLGYWLWDSLLRYPGLFVNEVAAASHLNIDTDDFGESEVGAIFEEALYKGPFADPKKPLWWRGMLDDIVSRENFADGLELVQKKVKSTIKRSKCCVEPSKSAGYYCIISRVCPTRLTARSGQIWWIMEAPAKIGDGLVNLDRVLPSFL